MNFYFNDKSIGFQFRDTFLVRFVVHLLRLMFILHRIEAFNLIHAFFELVNGVFIRLIIVETAIT